MIANLTKRVATPAQIQAGVVEPTPELKRHICDLLRMESLPTEHEIEDRAEDLAELAEPMGRVRR